MEVKRSMLVELPAERIFDIVEAAEHYPKFVPWCTDAVITERGDEIVGARITVEYKRLRFGFQTRNPKRRPQWLGVQLVEGPFRRFEGMWRFTPLSASACKIEFGLRCELSDFFLGRLAVPVFNYVTDTLVDAFVRRAEQVHAAEAARAAAAGAAAVVFSPGTTAGPPPVETASGGSPAELPTSVPGAPAPVADDSLERASTGLAPSGQAPAESAPAPAAVASATEASPDATTAPIIAAPAANPVAAPAPDSPAITVPPPATAAPDSPLSNPRPT